MACWTGWYSYTADGLFPLTFSHNLWFEYRKEYDTETGQYIGGEAWQLPPSAFNPNLDPFEGKELLKHVLEPLDEALEEGSTYRV